MGKLPVSVIISAHIEQRNTTLLLTYYITIWVTLKQDFPPLFKNKTTLYQAASDKVQV